MQTKHRIKKHSKNCLPVRCKSQLKNAEQGFNAKPLGQTDAEPQSEHGAERWGFVAGVALELPSARNRCLAFDKDKY
jgi:hypothetical protein